MFRQSTGGQDQENKETKKPREHEQKMKINKYNGRLKPQHINNYINYKLSKYTKEKHGPVR